MYEGNQKIFSNMQGIRKYTIHRKNILRDIYHLSNGSKLSPERKNT